jgi:hypothetical protein
VHHGSQQKHVGAGADEVVRVGHGGGFGAAGVNHHQFAAACLQALALPLKSGTVHMLPLLARGLAPITSKKSVR